jgi:hypothetical protein
MKKFNDNWDGIRRNRISVEEVKKIVPTPTLNESDVVFESGVYDDETKLEIPSFFITPPSGWQSVTLNDPSGPGIPAIRRVIPGIGTIFVIYSRAGITKTKERDWRFLGLLSRDKFNWSVHGDLSFIPDDLCRRVAGITDASGRPSEIARGYLSLREWKDIITAFSQAHSLVMYGRAS